MKMSFFSPHHSSSSSKEKHSYSLSEKKKKYYSDRKAELRLLHWFPEDEVLCFGDELGKTACHLAIFFGGLENPIHTQHGRLRWAERQSIELHDSVFVCHLCLMKQVGFSFNQYSCPLPPCKETDLIRACSRNCELRHIFHSSSARQSCGWVGPSETLTKYVPASPEDKKTLS